jgi:hypothetical protein
VQGLKAYPSVEALPEPADLALLIVPAQYVPTELDRCGRAGIRAAAILSSGFAEEGESGRRMQHEIAAMARRYDMAVSGPNAEGLGDSHPRGLFHHVAESLNHFGLAYLHLIEPRVKGGETIAEAEAPVVAQELSNVFRGPVIAAGGFSPETAERSIADGDARLIAFGRHFIANPDLPKRIALGLPLNPYDRTTFYGFDARGYTDYPFAKSV